MQLHRCLAVVLCCMPGPARAQLAPSSTPAWSPTLELANLAELPARFARPFREPVELVAGDVHRKAGNCAALLAARRDGASPAGDRDFAIERDEGARCVALEQLSHARPVRVPALATFELRTSRAGQLPPTLAAPFGKRDDERAQAAEARGQTLRDYLPGVAVRAAGDMLELRGETWVSRVEVLARADFDASGRDELLLAAHDQATQGTFENTRLLLVARRGEGGPLGTLKRLR